MTSELDNVISVFRAKNYYETIKRGELYIASDSNNLACWRVLTVSYKRTGQIGKAIESCETCIKLAPEDPVNYFNKGTILDSIAQFDKAEAAYKEAISRDSHFTVAWNNLGIARKKLKNMQGSEEAFKNAINSDPMYALSYYNLANLYSSLGMLTDAVDLYSKAIVRNSEYSLAYLNKGNALKELGDLGAAKTNYKIALERDPQCHSAKFNLGVLSYESSQFQRALSYFKQVANNESETYALRCFLKTGNRQEFKDQLEKLTERGVTNSTIGSLVHHYNTENNVKLKNPFAHTPFKYVIQKTFLTIDEAAKLLREIGNDEGAYKGQFKSQNLISNGSQTAGNLFERDKKWSNEIECELRKYIENYREGHGASEDGFIKKWPRNYRLVSWLVRLQKGGNIAPHIHENGWLGGAIYLKVPEKMKENEGNFVVTLNSQTNDHAHQRIMNVSVGDIILFPASLMHYTIPFHSKTERIVLAFDLIGE